MIDTGRKRKYLVKTGREIMVDTGRLIRAKKMIDTDREKTFGQNWQRDNG